jgi:acetyl-CoA C-acetyltransferase
MTACIVGWSHGKFGKLDGETSESLIVKAASEAIAHAGIEPKDVDVIYVGNMNGGFVRQEFHSSLALQTHPDLRFKPSTRVENACATGSAAIHMGLNTLAAGKARFVLVVGVEKMTELNSAQAGEVLIKASYVAEEADIEAGFAGIFGKITSAYFQRYGDKSDALAKIAVKAHRNGAKNPYAHFQKEFAYEFCRNPSDKNPFVAGPLKRTDCSPVTDGAAAVILTDVQTALGMKQAIAFRAAQHVNDFLPMSKRDIIKFEGRSSPGARWPRPSSTCSTSPSSRATTASPRPS